jgi:predicted ATPase
MIETLSLRNFKVLRRVEARLRPLTLIVGPNGSGKSTLLFALDYCLRRILGKMQGPVSTLKDGVLDASVLKSRIPEGELSLKLGGSSSDGLDFSFNLSFVSDAQLKIEAFREIWPHDLSRPLVLNLDLSKIAEPSYLREITKTLPSDGAGLSWFLAGLHLEFPERFADIVLRLREIVPAVRGLRMRRTRLESADIGYEILFDMKGGTEIPAREMSEGTLLALALLAAISAPESPGLVLIENLERGLHPKALRNLVDQIRLLQKQNPRLQVIATSHSPYLLDYLEADEILLTSLDEDGYASVRALSEHPDYDRWKDVMAPGEFWSTVGESWVVQKT